MKSIKLTKEHKSKLLEMCRKLFPEYNHYGFYKTEDELYNECDDLNLLHFTGHKTKGIQGYLVIHWFEFCMTHLSYKLQKELNKVVKDNERISLYHRNDPIFHTYGKDILCLHPVDYLYEEFKKLKQ